MHKGINTNIYAAFSQTELCSRKLRVKGVKSAAQETQRLIQRDNENFLQLSENTAAN